MAHCVVGSSVALDHTTNYGVMVDLHRETKPRVMLGMVDAAKDADRIRQMKRDLPGSQIIARVWHPEEGGYAQPPRAPGDNRPMIATPEAVLGEQVELGRNGLWLHVMNEPSAFMKPEEVQLTVDWLVKFIRLAAVENCACVLANLADQHPRLINGMWDPIWHPFLRAMAEFPHLMRLGLHFYGPDNSTDVLSALNETCKTELRILPPQVVGTEFGMDSTGQDDKLNGYHSRGLSGPQFLKWQVDEVQGPFKPFIASGQVIGFTTFQWNPLQGQFSIANDKPYQEAYKTAANEGSLEVTVIPSTPPAPSLPAFPSDFDTRAKTYMVRATEGSTTIRQAPSRQSSLVGIIAATPRMLKLIDAVDLRPDERVQETIGDHLGVWIPVMIGVSKGWSFNGYLDVQPVVIVEDPPKPAKVKWSITVTVDYPAGTPAECEASKQAWSGLADFLRAYVRPIGLEPEITVSEQVVPGV